MITNKFLHFEHESEFNAKKAEISENSIAFIDDAKLIYTHNNSYFCGDQNIQYIISKLESSLNQSKAELKEEITNGINGLRSELQDNAFSGSYNDLSDKPPVFRTDDYYTKNQIEELLNGIRSVIPHGDFVTRNQLAKVATTGEYSHLEHRPEIPVIPTTLSSFSNDTGFITTAQLSNYYTKNEVDVKIPDVSTLIQRIQALEYTVQQLENEAIVWQSTSDLLNDQNDEQNNE